MSEITRPSNLGEWATCAKKMRHLAANPRAGRGGSHIAGWVGDSVHDRLAGTSDPEDRPPPMALYDSITPDRKTAGIQVERIIVAFYLLMGRYGLTAKAWECQVEDSDGNSGTLDVVLRKDHPLQLVVADVKTGRRVPAGVWLQLGAYYKMAMHSLEEEWAPMVEVAVIHLPRTKLGEEQLGTIEFRDGEKCAAEADLWYRAIGNLLEDDAEVEAYPASPGLACSSCSMTIDECAVKIERPTN